MDDLIDRQAAAIDALQPEQKDFEKQLHDMFDHIWDCKIDHPEFQDTVGDLMRAVIQAHNNSVQPEKAAQPEQDREFIKLTVRNSNGRPYYSIIFLEFDDNGIGHDFEGYSSYSLDVISDYLKKYFMSSAQPETAKRIVGKSIGGITLWYQCCMCNEPVDAQDNFCRRCGRRLTDG